jgi:hypothetical protein
MPWMLANPYGILYNEAADAWHTGRVNALLRLPDSDTLLVGSDRGGVWEVLPRSEEARPLSTDWADPDMSALVQSNDPTVVFACTQNGALHVSDVAKAGSSIGDFRQAQTYDASGAALNLGWVWAGLMDPVKGRLVLACDSGLLWADVPSPGGDFVFHAAVAAPGTASVAGKPFSGVALGPSGGLIAAGKGPGLRGLFTARWSGNQLRVRRAASVNGVPISKMERTSLASVNTSPRFAYAITAQLTANGTDSVILAILRTSDGGRNWQRCPMSAAITKALGNQGTRNQAIAATSSVVPTKFSEIRVAAGMRRGPFVSPDGGDNWTENGDDWSIGLGRSPHLHPDVHVLWFDPTDPVRNTLFVGSDGGIARNRKFDELCFFHSASDHWETRPFNMRLPILEFSGSNLGTFGGGQAGSSAAPGVDFLIGGGTQDNHTIWSIASQRPTPWRVVERSGDGGYLTFVRTDSSLAVRHGLGIATDVNAGGEMVATVWDPGFSLLRAQGVIPVAGANGFGLIAPAGLYVSLSAVRTPRWPPRKDRVIAVCGSGQNIFGYIAQGGAIGEWRLLATLRLQANDFITAVGSQNGNPIYAGTNNGRLFAVTPDFGAKNASVQKLRVKAAPDATGAVTMILDVSDNLTLAAFNNDVLQRVRNDFTPIKGAGLPNNKGAGLPNNDAFRSITCDENGRVLFLALESGVFRSTDNGENWTLFSDGLPTMPHSADVFVGSNSGTQYLYLATWGRSIYTHQL